MDSQILVKRYNTTSSARNKKICTTRVLNDPSLGILEVVPTANLISCRRTINNSRDHCVPPGVIPWIYVIISA